MKLRVACPTCGVVEVGNSQIELLTGRPGGEPTAYAFDCPACSGTVRAAADAAVLRALAYLGTEVRVAPPAQLVAEDAEVAELRRLLDAPGFIDRLRDGAS